MDRGAGGPFGAVIVKGGAIVGRGHNEVTSTNDPTAHAEIVAIRRACARLGDFQLLGCEVYATCEPCPMCLGALYWARPSKIYFASTREDAAQIGFDDRSIYDELALAIPRRSMPMVQMLRDEAQSLFETWQQKSDKIEY